VRGIYAGVHSWRVKSSDGSWRRIIELYPPSYDAERKLDSVMSRLLRSLIRYTDAPRADRSYHMTGTCGGGRVRRETQADLAEERLQLLLCVENLRRLVQDAKVLGLPGGEAHRLDQYTTLATGNLEGLFLIKEYRTPQLFRAFSRVWIPAIGVLYSPYFLWLQQESQSLAVALTFAAAMQLSMSALFNIFVGLEDPFALHHSFGQYDSIRVAKQVEVTRIECCRLAKEARSIDWSKCTDYSRLSVTELSSTKQNDSDHSILPAT